VIATQLLLILAITCLVSAMVPFLPDLRQVLENLLLVFLFLSGVFIDFAQYPEKIKKILYLNPMAILISMYRKVLLEGGSPDWDKLLSIFFFSILTFLLAHWILRRYDRIYPKIIH
jgi:lipopolysaccharide transport system permease protein